MIAAALNESINTPGGARVRRSMADQFAQLRRQGQIALMPFIPAGYPDLATTEAAGAHLVEIGFPFSDPIADGPVIQESFTAALSKKLKIAQVFESVARV